jgi:hypothetical protein
MKADPVVKVHSCGRREGTGEKEQVSFLFLQKGPKTRPNQPVGDPEGDASSPPEHQASTVGEGVCEAGMGGQPNTEESEQRRQTRRRTDFRVVQLELSDVVVPVIDSEKVRMKLEEK